MADRKKSRELPRQPQLDLEEHDRHVEPTTVSAQPEGADAFPEGNDAKATPEGKKAAEGSKVPPTSDVSAPSKSIDPNRLRLTQNFGQVSPVTRRQLTIKVRRPHRQEFVQIHHSAEFRLDTMLLEYQNGTDTETYLVQPELWSALEEHVTPKMIYTAITAQNNVFLWCVRLPGLDGRLDAWSETAHAAAREAMKGWVSVRSNRAEGCYEIVEPVSKRADPEWPPHSFQELLTMAFRGRTIEDLDHPVLRALRGED